MQLNKLFFGGKMKHLLALLFVIPATLFAANHPKLDTVPYVNVQKYLGTWHEIARLPVFFQLNCYNATATYDVIDSKTIKVTNACESKVLGKKKMALEKQKLLTRLPTQNF